MGPIGIGLMALVLGTGAVHAVDRDPAAELLTAGERMYREGITPAGEAMRARVRGDVPVSAQQAACISCHRRSGMGSGEGQTVALPIAGTALYTPREPSVRQLAYLASRSARRPSYTDATLARAIREGIDATGQPLSEPMPRYDLSDDELKPLIAYLKTLSSEIAPGVSATEIHFAVVLSDDVKPELRQSMLDVLDAYLRDKNADTRRETRRAERGPWTMKDYRAYRKWRLHVWELSGPRATWPQQLDAYYRQQPVFAMLSGLATGPWQPIHAFCEAHQVPCLFPNTDLPVVAETGFYSIYFSKGITLEAEALAAHLAREAAGPVVQVFTDDTTSTVAAQAFRAAMRQRDLEVRDVALNGRAANAELWKAVLKGQYHAQLVLWLSDVDLSSLVPWASVVDRLFLSSTLWPSAPAMPVALHGKVMSVHPFVLPEKRTQQLARVHNWLRVKRIPAGDERIQANAYFAATVAADGLMKIANVFSREYFIERIEDMMDDAVTTAIYPRVSLGQGQRYVSKGAYLVDLPASDGHEAVWVVP